MGNSLYRADFKDVGQPDAFAAPAWAYRWESPEDFAPVAGRTKAIVRPEAFDQATRGPGRRVASTGLKRGGAFTWYVELGGMSDTIHDAERIRDELFRIHVGLWDYAKNRDPAGIKANARLRMVWLNYVPGVRESRRLMGDYIMTQKDFDEPRVHPDTVAFTDWGIDDHQPHGFFTKGIDAIHVYGGRRVSIPFRSLYSKNIANLFIAGRCMSASHMALGGVRVQRPMAATGQAVGTVAAIATKHGVQPRAVYQRHIAELQQTLLKDGCYLVGVKNQDPLDHARGARTKQRGVVDGWNREIRNVSKAVAWRSEPIELEFATPTTVACVHLSLANRHHRVTFAVDGFADGAWRELARSAGVKARRRHVLNVASAEVERLRFRLIRSSAPVAVAEIRVYSQPGDPTEDVFVAPETSLPGIVVDDDDAERVGTWKAGIYDAVVGAGYIHDDNEAKGGKRLTFRVAVPKPGDYTVRLLYREFDNRASNVPVSVRGAGAAREFVVDQRSARDGGATLGDVKALRHIEVIVSNAGTDAYVVVDGVQVLSRK